MHTNIETHVQHVGLCLTSCLQVCACIHALRYSSFHAHTHRQHECFCIHGMTLSSILCRIPQTVMKSRHYIRLAACLCVCARIHFITCHSLNHTEGAINSALISMTLASFLCKACIKNAHTHTHTHTYNTPMTRGWSRSSIHHSGFLSTHTST